MKIFYIETDSVKTQSEKRKAYVLCKTISEATHEFCVRFGVNKHDLYRCTQISDNEDIITVN